MLFVLLSNLYLFFDAYVVLGRFALEVSILLRYSSVLGNQSYTFKHNPLKKLRTTNTSSDKTKNTE